MMMVVNAFLCVFLDTMRRLSWSCREKPSFGRLDFNVSYGIGTALLEKRRRGASR